MNNRSEANPVLRGLAIIIALYAGLMLVIIGFILVLVLLADSASFNQSWVEDAVPSLLDMLKVVVGAAVGSLSTAAVAVFGKKEK